MVVRIGDYSNNNNKNNNKNNNNSKKKKSSGITRQQQQKQQQQQQQRVRRYDKALLNSFLAASFLVACSIIFVPFNIEYQNGGEYTIHGVVSVNDIEMDNGNNNNNNNNNNHADSSYNHREDTAIKIDKSTVQAIKKENHHRNKKRGRKEEEEYHPKLHVMVSTGCSTFQDWQSYVFFFHVLKSGQEGHITRIASGCDSEAEKALREVFAQEIEPMAPGRVHLHLTPEYGNIKPGLRNFKYFNKPMGTKHWFEHGLGYPNNYDKEQDDTVFVLMDPDQIMLRPFTGDFTNEAESWRLKKGYKLRVEHGSPFSQQYGYGLQWLRKVNVTQVFNGEPTPVLNMTSEEAYDYYMAMGPPYVATGKDMYAIVSKWTEIVTRVHNDYPHLLAEMFGYNLAAAHLGLRHTVAKSFMVSDVWAGGEGWKLLEKVSNKDICHNYPKSQYPHVIHYCQRYYIGKYFIGKHRLRKDFISCEAPLLMVPPDDIALRYNFAIMPDGDEIRELKPQIHKSEAFMTCAMINALNEAAVYYKDHHCDKATANYEYNYTFHDNMTIPDNIIQQYKV